MQTATIDQPAAIEQPKAAGEKRLLTPSDLAELFGREPSTILRWNRQGKLPRSVAPEGSPRWTHQQIKAYLEGRGA